MNAQYKQAKKQLMELLEGKNEKAINFVVSQFEGLAKAQKENIVRAGIVDAILGQITKIPNKNMQTLYFLVEQFRKGEIMQVTDSAYDELQTDLRKRLIFEFHSFFWTNEISFSAIPEKTQFSIQTDTGICFIRLLIGDESASEAPYSITCTSEYEDFTTEDIELAFAFLGKLLKSLS